MLLKSQLCLTAILALALPAVGFSAAIELVNNGTCEVGNCASPDSIGVGQVSTGGYSFTYTFGDGDKYGITGTYSNAYPPQILGFFPTVTYLGATPAAGSDTISLTLFQDFYDPTPGTWNGSYCEGFPAVIAAGGSATDTTTYGGTALKTLTVGPGTSGQSSCSNLTFGAAQNASAYFAAQIALSFTFPAGTSTNAFSASPSPEPVQTIPVGAGLLLVLASARKRFKYSN